MTTAKRDRRGSRKRDAGILGKLPIERVDRPTIDSVRTARTKFLNSINEQIDLANSPSLKGRRWTFYVEKQLYIQLRFGNRPLQTDRGSAVRVDDDTQVITTLELIRDAAQSGEFDEVLLAATERNKRRRKRQSR